MKMVKAIRQQAATAERVAVNTADTYVADQMRALAQAFKFRPRSSRRTRKRRKNELFRSRRCANTVILSTAGNRRSRPQEGPGDVARRLL
jgi:4'-phosphopantetheinyl transferase EntD